MTRRLAALALVVLLPAPSITAQQPDTLPGVRRPLLRRDTLRIVLPAELRGAGRLVSPRPSPERLARAWADSLQRRLAAAAARRWAMAALPERADSPAAAAPPGPVTPVPEAAVDRPAAARPIRTIQEYAQLDLQMNARMELRFDRLRNLRCTPGEVNQLGSGCRGGFNPPRFEPQFNVRSGGVVGQRIHVGVDYDSEREFEASNDIRVYYEGLEDEILRRVDVGNVTFAPPASRFITGGIPANNFGLQVQAQLGGLDLTGIFAQQKGNVVRDRTYTIGDRTVQPIDRELADRDYERQRFFFIVDPAGLPNYPAVDVLALAQASLPATSRVSQARVYRRRAVLGVAGSAGQNLTGIDAVALREDSPQRAGPFAWELLLEGRDYYLDPSGAWFALVARLDQDDYLAVSYVTAAGDTVGTFPGTSTPGRVDTLLLVHEPRRGTDAPTFRHEMRNAYRVGSVGDVVRSSTALRLVVGESERPATGASTFLAQLGLAESSDPSRFDQFNRLFPRERDPGAGSPLRDYFVVFPHLTPFADEASLPPEFRNDSLYRTPAYLLFTQGPTPLFSLGLHYDASGGDDRSILSLGGFQLREGSEQITAGGRLLTRNVEYTINYEIGQVTFTSPDSLFREPTAVVVRYEEQPGFAIAPTSIYGLQARYDLGEHGSLTALGLLQRERTTFTRPPLGFEPSSNFVGGFATSLRFQPDRLTRLLDALPLVGTSAPSLITLDAELAISRPSPNQLGVAYVETFEAEGGSFLGLGESLWEYGSRPSSARGLGGAGVDPLAGFRDEDAVPLVWQNLWAGRAGVVQFRPRDIDPSIQVLGAAETTEPVLWLWMHPDTVGGLPDSLGRPRWIVPHAPGPRWRSFTQPLSVTGVDLSRVEYLEFWVYEDGLRPARDAGATLAFDFGTVYEDAVDFQPRSLLVAAPGDTVYYGRRRAGEGRLDTERDTLTNAFNASINDTGILGDVADSILDEGTGEHARNVSLCRSEMGLGLVIYSWGDLSSRCTRRNGVADSEDLNGDQHLDTLVSGAPEAFFRYVFPLGDQGYWVRDGGTVGADSATAGRWRLYRIPFRSDTLQIGVPNIRQVRALRVTLVVPDAVGTEQPVYFALSRVKLVGSPWVKRSGTPIAGLGGSQGTGHGEVIASVVSTENRGDLGYEPPPGVSDAGETLAGGLQSQQVQINERSLRLVGYGVRPGERAEAFYRFPEGDRNFLGYRQLRVWARGRGGAWDRGELSWYVKVAQDEHDFYLYRARASTTSWEPEGVVDFERWLSLRAQIESRYLRGDPPGGSAACGGDSLAYVACDGPYLVQVRQPGISPPNLTRVRELAVGFVRDSGVSLDSAEVWVDDIRLSGVVDDAGYAGALSLRVAAADVAELSASLVRRDGRFRQLGEDPSYVGTSQLSVASTVRLERLGLGALGLTAPLTVRVDRSSQDPYYLSRTDVRADGLDGLRRPRSAQTAFSLALRRSRRGTLWWQRAFVDNLSLSASASRGEQTTEMSTSRTSALDVRADYAVSPGERTVRWVPGFVRSLVSLLPSFVRESEFGRGVEATRLRWTPAQLRLAASYGRVRADRQVFRAPVALPADTLVPTTLSFSATLQHSAAVELRPFRTVTAGLDVAQVRDLRDYGDSTTLGLVARQDSRRLFGVGVGFERRRTVRTRIFWQPLLASWLRPRLGLTSSFDLNRDPNAGAPERGGADSSGAFRLPSAFGNERSSEFAASVDLSRLLRGAFGGDAPLLRLLDRFDPLDLSSRLDRRSQFQRAGFDPGLGYQLALGGIDGFLEQREVVAASAGETRDERLAGGVRLPLGMSVSTEYQRRAAATWTRRGGGAAELRQRDVTWPSLTGRWVWTPPAGLLRRVVSSVRATASWRNRETETVQPGREGGGGPDATGEIRSGQKTSATPVTVNFTIGSRVMAGVTVSDSRSEDVRSGNVTRIDRSDASADLSFSFTPPREYLPLPSDVRASLRYSVTASDGCVRRAGSAVCVPISDSRRRQVNLTMDTDMPPSMSAGLAISYILTEDAHVNRKLSQLVVTAFLTIGLMAGTGGR